MSEQGDPRGLITAQRAFAHVKQLTPLGPRVAGTPREKQAADYIAEQFASFGLPVVQQPVPDDIVAWEGGEARLRILGPGDVEELTACPVLGSVPTPPEGIEAEVVYGGRGMLADYEGLDLAGKVILHDPPRARTLDNRCGAGEPQRALGTPGHILQVPCLAGPEGTPLPAVGTTYEGGLRLKELLQQWYATPAGIAAEAPLPVKVWMKVEARREAGEGTNVIATLKGGELPRERILLCDNAASVAIVLEVARALAQGPPPRRTVQFLTVTGEEYGSVGSGYFVSELAEVIEDVKACIVLDIVGSGNKYYYITTSVFAGEVVENSSWLNQVLSEQAADLGYHLEPTQLEFASDDGPFLRAGVPTSYLCRCISTSWPYLHTYLDDPDIIDYNALKVLGDLCATALLKVANAPELPSR